MQAGDLLVESQHAYSFEPVRVVIEVDHLLGKDKVLRALSEKIAEALKPRSAQKATASEFKIVSHRQDPGWIIYLLRPETRSGKYIYPADATLPTSIPSNPPEAWVLSPQEELLDDTLRVELGDAEKGIKELVRRLNIVADMRDLIKLTNDPPPFSVQAHC